MEIDLDLAGKDQSYEPSGARDRSEWLSEADKLSGPLRARLVQRQCYAPLSLTCATLATFHSFLSLIPAKYRNTSSAISARRRTTALEQQCPCPMPINPCQLAPTPSPE